MKNGKKFSGWRDCGKGRMRQWYESRMVGGGGGVGVTRSGGARAPDRARRRFFQVSHSH